MKYLCPAVLVPVLRLIEWAFTRTAVYVYDFDGERQLKIAYRTRSGLLATKYWFGTCLLLPDGSTGGISWKHSWEPVFQSNQKKQQEDEK